MTKVKCGRKECMDNSMGFCRASYIRINKHGKCRDASMASEFIKNKRISNSTTNHVKK